jgi:hypothetical protein
MGTQMIEESKQKLDKDFDELHRSMAESHQHEQARMDREQEENSARITRDTFRSMETDSKLDDLKRQFQREDQQRRIEDGRKAIQEEEEDNRLMDSTIAHDAAAYLNK